MSHIARRTQPKLCLPKLWSIEDLNTDENKERIATLVKKLIKLRIKMCVYIEEENDELK